jgi:5-hydroxyisourate hydrolase-like protein (transthyretin family)
MPSPITTHVLDASRGCPASGVVVVLEMQNPATGGWQKPAFNLWLAIPCLNC